MVCRLVDAKLSFEQMLELLNRTLETKFSETLLMF